jgi:outer membrane immunogenic protein
MEALMRRTTLATVALVGIASVASAADLPTKAPVAPYMAPVYSWTGFYIGGDVGALRTRVNQRFDPLPDVPFFGVFPISGDLNKTGFIGGLHAGYNWQLSPSWVLGFEGDWSWTDAKASFTQPWTSIIGPTLRPTALTIMSIEPNSLATIRGRIGYLVTPTALLYFTGGGAWADAHYRASANNEPDRPDRFLSSASFSKTASGYVLGGGFEWALWSSHWSLRAEYLYYHLNTSNLVIAPDSTGNFAPPNVALPSQFTWGKSDLETVRVGASYKF